MTNDNYFTNKITTVNSIMCVLVVFLHSENIDKYGDSTYRWIRLLESFVSGSLGDIAVPIFFFMSSILFFQNYDLKKIWLKYKSRIFSVVIPYFLWNFLYLIFFFILINNPLSQSFMDTKEITINLKVIFDSILFHQYNGAYWFMYQIRLFIIISPIIYVIMKNPYGIVVISGLIVFSYWFPNIPNIPNGIMIKFLIYWLLGAYLILHIRNKIYHRTIKKKIYLTLSLSIALLLVRFYLEFANQELGVGNYTLDLLLVPNVIAIWFALDILKFNKTYAWMGMTFFIYSVHPLIVDAIKKGMYVLLPKNNIMALGNYIVSGIGGTVISVYIAKLLIRFTPKVYSILCGGRN